MSATQPEHLRVGFLCLTNPADPTAMAGMPHRMAAALEERVGELVRLAPPRLPKPGRVFERWPILGRAVRYAQWRWLTFDGAVRPLEQLFPGRAEPRTLKVAADLGTAFDAATREHDLDVLFGCIASWPLYRCRPDLPAVFYTDATTTMVNATYPRFADRADGFKRACIEIENSVYSRCHAVGVPAGQVLESAVRDHGLPQEKGHVIPMGANVVPETPLESVEDLSRPARDDLRLSIIASDPTRKRLDFAVEVAEQLAARGWACRLSVIGPPTGRARASQVADCLGPLHWSEPADRQRIRATLAAGHFFVLPSTAEGAAIAPAEAAHFGRPAIVSDVAGLPSVVLDGETGRVLPLATATPVDYADAIEELAGDPGAYRTMSDAVLARAQAVFTWDAWGERMAGLLGEAASERV